MWQQDRVSDLDPAFHDLNEADMQATFNVGSYAAGGDTMRLEDLYRSLQRTYCGSIGAEYMHITSTDEKRWIQSRLEPSEAQPNLDNDSRLRILKNLT